MKPASPWLTTASKFDNDVGLGNSYVWQLPPWHPLHFFLSVWHDEQYRLRAIGLLPDKSSKRVDKEALERAIRVYETCRLIRTRKKDRSILRQAYFFYRIMRVWGVFLWPKPKEEKVI